MSFVRNYLILSSGIYQINAQDELGLKTYYIVEVIDSKREMLKVALNRQAFKPADYGRVLLSGYGDGPSAEEIAKLKADYKLS